ncbi:TetR/AcrR family transcriptional regulator [Gilvimarinus sp. DA14]|uniref:TetR/AcrR family transcriptional regulator n=1 Tax=Gilvimarinus sp. DA14 TaxID=2956798 RepID=UPI0020B797BB|nr:TetR/AcrR family transcriptional regulator [Gilvimarinus sp. DA14]UTF58912.1 TetR/AcrR family transcriptional regulator [Gilvimarinus sp. DA14]
MKLSEKKRLQILEAAENLFAQEGLDATSMDQVAAVAQVSKRTVYNHFATKTDLFVAMLEGMFHKLKQGDILSYDPARSIAAQLTEVAQQEAELLSSEEFLQLARVTFIQLLQDQTLAQSLNKSSIGCLRYLEPLLTAALADGVLKIEDIPLAARQFVYQLKSLIFYPRLYGVQELNNDTQTIINETVKMFMARYGA